MKVYPNADAWFYVENPSSVNGYMKYPPNHSWKINDTCTSRVMRYWRDSEGIKKPEIKLKDLYFTDWPKNRIRPQACLGLLYATGNRFIKLTKAPPAGFKCAPMPVNLETARIVKVLLKKKAKADKKAKKAKKNAEKKAKGKDKGKGKGKGGDKELKPKVIKTYKDAEKM
ncbi:hypothetical protein KR038_011447 [Drosophila bunnanda]|nr:hypothetical protein KR038_011447 [Drosophila bunnanda]